MEDECTIENVRSMIEACATGTTAVVEQLFARNPLYARQQDTETGMSPLMAAAKAGNTSLCQFLLDQGAPWNAIDRMGQCAGNYATLAQHWETVNLLVDWGTRSELILGASQRNQPRPTTTATIDGPVQHQPSTKPDYLRQRLVYNETALLDADQDAVMMEWERPLMQVHASILLEGRPRQRVLNVGFGMGIVDTALQAYNPAMHIIIEAHPDVHARMLADGWHRKPNVRVCFGKWQDVLPQLMREGVVLDAIFFDTYGEHYMDMQDFHTTLPHLLSKPNGIYSFFNGLAPDNLFFHGVACQCVKLQLAQLGLDSEFLPCEFQVGDEKVWEGTRRKYWHNMDTYYLPRVTWNQGFLSNRPNAAVEDSQKQKAALDIVAGQAKKRPKVQE